MSKTPATGAVATGHAATAEAAAFALREGGNAFDAAIAAHWTACIAEPVLTSLGGGGFLLAQPDSGRTCIYDFFAQTPRHKRPETEIDFHPIHADFGTTRQEFHIGYGAVATPGTVRGLFAIHRDLGSLPMPVLMEPAVELAGKGLRVNKLQASILDVVRPVYLATPQATQRFASRSNKDTLVGEGETLYLPELADTFALGSGGSNRIRSAILQVLLRVVDEQLSLPDAIDRPRIHYENGLLNIEDGFDSEVYQQLQGEFEQTRCWPDRNLFFGGVHAVSRCRGEFEYCGDQRRGGVAFSVSD